MQRRRLQLASSSSIESNVYPLRTGSQYLLGVTVSEGTISGLLVVSNDSAHEMKTYRLVYSSQDSHLQRRSRRCCCWSCHSRWPVDFYFDCRGNGIRARASTGSPSSPLRFCWYLGRVRRQPSFPGGRTDRCVISHGGELSPTHEHEKAVPTTEHAGPRLISCGPLRLPPVTVRSRCMLLCSLGRHKPSSWRTPVDGTRYHP